MTETKKVTHEINHRDDEFAKDVGSQPCVRVVDYKDQEILDALIDPDEVITQSEKIKIRFDYPLSNPTTFSFNKDGSFTRKDLFRAIYTGYEDIYASEENPGMIEGTYNRATSEGPYGIWGHVIEDLFIEGVVQISKDSFTLQMGS